MLSQIFSKNSFLNNIVFISKDEVELPYIISADFDVEDHLYITNVALQVGGLACIIKWIDWYMDDVVVQSQPPNFIEDDQVSAPFVDMAEFGDICSKTTIYAGIRFLEQDSVLSNHVSYFKNDSIIPSECVVQFFLIASNKCQMISQTSL